MVSLAHQSFYKVSLLKNFKTNDNSDKGKVDFEESQSAKLLDEKDDVSFKRTIKRYLNLFRTFHTEKRGNGELEGPSKARTRICEFFCFL